MKHIVFDNWLLMAIAATSAIRIRALDTIPLLVSGKDFIGAALSTYSPARRSRSNDAQIGTLKVDHLPEPNTPYIYILSRRTNGRTITRDAMILTKLSKAQRRDTKRVEPHTQMNTHLGTQVFEICIA
jgi:hypothetical protein